MMQTEEVPDEVIEVVESQDNCIEDKEEFSPNVSAEIIGTQTREDEENGKYTVYEIKVVETKSGQESYVFRRYSEFCKLYEQIAQHYPEIQQEYSLPATSWFYTFHEDTIRHRREKFDEFLRLLLNTGKYAQLNEVAEFLTYDLNMLQKALSFFRAKLYSYKQTKDFDMTEERKVGMEKSQDMVKKLNRTVRSESFRKAQAPKATQVEEREDETVIQLQV